MKKGKGGWEWNRMKKKKAESEKGGSVRDANEET